MAKEQIQAINSSVEVFATCLSRPFFRGGGLVFQLLLLYFVSFQSVTTAGDANSEEYFRGKLPYTLCRFACALRPECVQFIWHKDWFSSSKGTCILKGAPSNATDLPVKLFPAASDPTIEPTTAVAKLEELSAFPDSRLMDFSERLNSPITGRTTRYWHCCKPVCAWSGRMNTDTPVNSCDKSGSNVVKESGDGCNGGDAYICNDFTPFPFNDTLAYGFAAAKIPGVSEKDLCCSCYKLDFVSGPVIGKSMIVQVIDGGDDLTDNHFNLHIPGGGMGDFNGCLGQWGLPASVWGERFGGVTKREECVGLPKALQEGCNFRFDWFQGADNPKVAFSRVRCPNALEKITNCIRRF